MPSAPIANGGTGFGDCSTFHPACVGDIELSCSAGSLTPLGVSCVCHTTTTTTTGYACSAKASSLGAAYDASACDGTAHGYECTVTCADGYFGGTSSYTCVQGERCQASDPHPLYRAE